MKNFINHAIIVIALFFTVSKTSAQSANTYLSNLASPTKANQSLSPGTNGSYDLGSSGFGWRNIYLAGYLYLKGKKFISNPGTENNFIGTNAGYSLTSGMYNTAVGSSALYFTTSGGRNIASGYRALYSNTTGGGNTAVGTEAMYFNINGYNNTALGDGSLYFNSGGSYNTATGKTALYHNYSGSYNSANGYFALGYNTSGDYNTANGYFALLSNTVGQANTATGAYALNTNTSGLYNTAFGAYSLYSNQTGYDNQASGTAALQMNTTGKFNTANGMQALLGNTTGNYNTGVGFNALKATTASYFNTAIGYNAGYSYNNGYNNVFLGANCDVNGAGYYNDIAIGQGVICTDVSQARIGNSATSSIGGYANWTNISDGRVKKNIQQNVPGLTFINKLQPVTYNLNLDAADKIIQAPERKDSAGRIVDIPQFETVARKAKEQIVYTGFVAQDVEIAAKSLGYDFSGVDAAKNDRSLYGLRYAEFVVPLVKAVQELSAKNDDLQNQINELKSLIIKGNSLPTATSNAYLKQNMPNPSNSSTVIRYYLPDNTSRAQIIITDVKGSTIKVYNASAAQGSLNISTSELPAGIYNYTLYVNDKNIDTKQMVIMK